MAAIRPPRTTTDPADGERTAPAAATWALEFRPGDDAVTRVLPLGTAPVRVGRGVQCEVRLDQAGLGDVQCILRRRGHEWQVQPVGPPGRISIDGRPTENVRPLAPGALLRVGQASFTVHEADPDRHRPGSFDAPITIDAEPVGLTPLPTIIDLPGSGPGPDVAAHPAAGPPADVDPGADDPAGLDPADDRAKRWQTRLDQRDQWLRDRRSEKRWEARWKAAGETLRARSAPADSGPAAPARPELATPPAPTRPVARPFEPRPVFGHLRRGPDAEPRPEPPRAPARPPVVEATPAPAAATPAPIARAEPIAPRPPWPVAPEPIVEAPASPAPPEAPAVAVRPDAVAAAPIAVAAADPDAAPAAAADAPPSTLAFTFDHVQGILDGRAGPAGLPAVDPPAADLIPPAPVAAPAAQPIRVAAVLAPPVEAPAPAGPIAAAVAGPIVSPPPAVESRPEPAAPVPPPDVPIGPPPTIVPPLAGPGPAEPTVAPQAAPRPRRAAGRIRPVDPVVDPLDGSTLIAVPAKAPRRDRRADPADGPATGVSFPPAEPRGPTGPAPQPAAAAKEWPSARAIFAAQETRATGPATTAARESARARPVPEPTDPVRPDGWTIPLVLGWLPTAAAVLACGCFAVGLAAIWVEDASSGNIAVRLATRPEAAHSPVIDPQTIPKPAWWQTTAGHLAAWALTLERAGNGDDRTAEARALEADARAVSPLGARARFVSEPVPGQEADVSASIRLGPTRDVVTLTAMGHRLRRENKRSDAVRAYRAAFLTAATTARATLGRPVIRRDPQVNRYALPHATLLDPIARDMAEAGEWTPEEWTEATPEFGPALLAVADALRPKEPAEAERRLEAIVRGAGRPLGEHFEASEDQAAVAEAMAERGRWTDGVAQYRLAIEGETRDLDRRVWWFNLAELARRGGDGKLRDEAIESAKGADLSDEVTQRAANAHRNAPEAGLGGRNR